MSESLPIYQHWSRAFRCDSASKECKQQFQFKKHCVWPSSSFQGYGKQAEETGVVSQLDHISDVVDVIELFGSTAVNSGPNWLGSGRCKPFRPQEQSSVEEVTERRFKCNSAGDFQCDFQLPRRNTAHVSLKRLRMADPLDTTPVQTPWINLENKHIASS